MLGPIGDYTARKSNNAGTGFHLRRAIGKDAGNGGHIRDPASVDFLFDLNRLHNTLPTGRS